MSNDKRNVEIERKYLIREMPKDLEAYPHRRIEQGYLSKNPTIRVRMDGDRYYMTYKSGGLMERIEYNLPLVNESYLHLLKKTDGRVIKKERYLIPIEGSDLKVELDVFEVPPSLVMAEVEFDDITSAESFVPPPWFDKEVTGDPRYHNVNMAFGDDL